MLNYCPAISLPTPSMSFPELTSKPIEHVNDNEEPPISIITFQSISDGRETFKEDRPAPLFKFPFNRRTPHRLIDGRIYYTIISFRDTFTCHLPKLNDLVGQSSPKSVVNDSGRNIVAKRVPPLTGLPECELPKSMYGSVDDRSRTHYLAELTLFAV